MTPAQSVDFSTEKIEEFFVHSVDENTNTIFFGCNAEDFSQRRMRLHAPDAEDFYVKQAKKLLSLSDPGISDRQMVVVDTTTNEIVRMKSTDPEQYKNLMPLWKVRFDSLGY